METQWIVEVGDELYGPFFGLQGANFFCDQFQARGSVKIRKLNPVPENRKSSQAELG